VILNGNQRGNARDLALHLMKAENERVEIHELRGFMSHDLMGALNELYAVSRATRCDQFMYSLSLNPPKGVSVSNAEFEQAIEQAEQRLGLTGQARAIVFHEKQGRRHCHVVWSRIDLETMKAVQMSYDREKLTALSKELFIQRGWEMPRGLKERGERNSTNYTYDEHQQAQRVGKNAAQIKAEIQEAWAASDTRAAFEHALAERGYILTRWDRRDFVVVDAHGEVYSLPRMVGVKTKDVRARLGDGADLPSVEEVKAQWAQARQAEHIPEPEQEDFSKEDALELLCRYHAAFTQAMMERTLKAVIADDKQRKQLIDDILQSDEVITIGMRDGQDVYAKHSMIELEQRMIDAAQAMAQTATHRMDEQAVERAVSTLNDQLAKDSHGKPILSAEQIHVLHHITRDRQLCLVVGVAGAGKTTIMQAAKDALEAQGYRVRGAAPSGIAAAGLQDIGIQASTLHSLEARIAMAQRMLDENMGKPFTPRQQAFVKNAMLTSNDVLIIDKAGMVSAKQLANMIQLTRQSGAKLVLVGDPAQLQSIEAGAAFRTLLERNESASLTEVRRQKTNWQRKATLNLAEGRVSEALYAYEKRDCIYRSKTREDAKAELVTDFMEMHEVAPDSSHLVLAYTRKDVTDLNAMIKAERRKRGAVSAEDTQVAVTLKDGDYDIEETQGFAVGDRIMFRENNRDMGVMNGTFGTLHAIKGKDFHVRLDNGKTVQFSPQDYRAFQLGYAATVHKSQGVTVDEAFVLATPHFDRHTTYVAMSRHKQNVKLYASQRDFKTKSIMHQSLSKQGEKLSTLDFTDPQAKQPVPEHNLEVAARPSWKTRIKSGAKSVWKQLRGKPQGKTTPESNSAPDTAWLQTPDQAKSKKHHHTPQPSRLPAAKPLSQQDISALRDQFMAQAQSKPARNPTMNDRKPDRGPDMGRFV
jgi:ATP-dependent exoDNAse (exonuclease V) alpha subunit